MPDLRALAAIVVTLALGGCLPAGGGTTGPAATSAPVLFQRPGGGVEVDFAGGCAILFDASGILTSRGAGCSDAQQTAAEAAVAATP